MRIDYIKANLKNIVLLAKEYKEKIPDHLSQEMQKIDDVVSREHTVSEYDKQFYINVQREKIPIFNQIVYFGKEILLLLSKSLDRKRIIEIDWDKVHELKNCLSNRQLNVISKMLEILLIPENEKCENEDSDEKQLEKLIDIAAKINPESLPSRQEIQEKEAAEKLQMVG